jgi:hypothetical protein
MSSMAGTDNGIKRALLYYSACAAGVFFIVMLAYTNFKLSAPLDDVFIYFQYAKNLAAGHFFEYVTGDGYSSGATSFLYVFLLAPFAPVFRGESLIIVTYFIGGICLFYSGYYIYRIIKELTGRELYSWFGAALFVTNGNFLWGYFSGMEICVFSSLIIASLYYIMRPRAVKEQVILLCLLSVIRPEGFFLAVTLAGVKLLFKAAGGKAVAKGKFFAYLVPLIPGICYFCINKVFTGYFLPNTMRAKSDFAQYYFYWPDVIRNGLEKYASFLMNVFNGRNEHWFFHYSMLVFLLGLLPGAFNEIRGRKAGIFTISLFWFFIGALSTVFSSFFAAHNYRYPMPFAGIFTVFFVYGLYYLLGKLSFGSKKTAVLFTAAVMSVYLVFNVMTIFANTVNFGRDCRDVLKQSISAGKWIKNNLPKNAKIGINDVGAITYFSGAKIYDMVGLVTNGQAKYFRNGISGAYEELEHARPDYFMVHLGWFNYERFSFFGRGDKRLTTFNIDKEPPYFVVGSPEVCTKFKTELVNSGDTMKADHTGHGNFKQKSRLDVQDLRDEKAHSYRIFESRVPQVPGTMLEEGLSYGHMLIDAGRTTTGGEEFIAEGFTPGKDIKIVRRSFDPGPYKIKVRINAKDAGVWQVKPGAGFLEDEFTVPGSLVDGPKLTIRLEAADKTGYNVFYYWLLQRRK